MDASVTTTIIVDSCPAKMSKGVTTIWIIVSVLFTLAVVFSFVTPVWFENKIVQRSEANVTESTNVSFGPLRYCSKSQLDDVVVKCKFYSGLMNIPSTTWILCSVVYALGCSLLCTALCCAFVGCCIREETWERVRLSAAYLQLFGVVFISLALLFFPLGLSSSFVHKICGPGADMYKSGNCQISWGYVLAIMSAALLIFSPILARYSIDRAEPDDGPFATNYRPAKVSTAV
ncbi:LHFPL tetraspan subfamily member 6 protein-like isoform X2 [Rhopilema esculentum]|uniref:LHFPL tetraspan subfamily member 6 protein-like isoform X2 n=1 Tax=Rhopilema esculentum TaxID=499914 RepID=UPI0031DFC9A6